MYSRISWQWNRLSLTPYHCVNHNSLKPFSLKIKDQFFTLGIICSFFFFIGGSSKSIHSYISANIHKRFTLRISAGVSTSNKDALISHIFSQQDSVIWRILISIFVSFKIPRLFKITKNRHPLQLKEFLFNYLFLLVFQISAFRLNVKDKVCGKVSGFQSLNF